MTAFLDTPDDLFSLKLIDPKLVKEFLSKLNAYDGGQKLVAAIGTGGTISMKVENGVRVPDLDFNSIFDYVGNGISKEFEIIALDAFCINSSQMTYGHILEICVVMTYIYKNMKAPFLGFLITHGTDTMAFSAAAVSLIMGQGLPFSIVYTGAQKPIQEKMSDAGSNLIHALYTLEALFEKNMAEVVITIGNKAILGTSSMKVDDTLADGFDAPLHHYVANFSALDYPIKLAPWLKPKRPVNFFPTIFTAEHSQTLVIHSSLGLCHNRIKTQIEDEQIRAVLLYSYATGTVHDDITNTITESATLRDIPVFVISPVNSEYKVIYDAGKRLIDKGVTPLYMTLPTALAKIEIALGFHEGNKQKIADFMTTNYVGEIPSEHSRFSSILER